MPYGIGYHLTVSIFFYIGVADHFFPLVRGTFQYSILIIHYSIAKRYGLRVYILPCASLPAPVPLYLLFAVLKR